MTQSITDILAEAQQQGASASVMKRLKAMLGQNVSNSNKKHLTKDERVTKRKMQKQARRKNRGVNQGKRAKKTATHRVGFG